MQQLHAFAVGSITGLIACVTFRTWVRNSDATIADESVLSDRRIGYPLNFPRAMRADFIAVVIAAVGFAVRHGQ